ncbi:hypothetical protein Tco_0853716, partial [Tanacetum coccineum]
YTIMNTLRRHEDWTCVEMSKWHVMEARVELNNSLNKQKFMLLVLVFPTAIQDEEEVACDGGCCSRKQTLSIA